MTSEITGSKYQIQNVVSISQILLLDNSIFVVLDKLLIR